MKLWTAIISIFITTSRILNASWDPEYIPTLNNELKDPEAAQLEKNVINYIKNSWCSEEKAKLLLRLVINTQPRVCVEIGAWTGSSTLPMVAGLQYLDQGQAYIIDAWSNQSAIQGLPKKDSNTTWWAEVNMQAVKNQFTYTMNFWSLNSYFQVCHMSSDQAISLIPAIDFLHLDGNFSEEGALLDSQLYVPKVTSGGYILLSNVLLIIEEKPTKMKALWPIFEQCDIIYEIENGNAILFKKK